MKLRFSRRAGVTLAIIVGCHTLWQGHGVLDPAFRNPDVAGIAYNARLLLTGGLPYADSSEIKPPGAFLLFAPLIASGGMRIVWAAAVLWGTALSLATGALARASFGRRAGMRAALLHAVCAGLASDGDINYSFWMATPFTLAAACAAAAVTSESERRKLVSWFASGALALFAVAIKPSAWPLAGLFALLLGRELWLGRGRDALRGAVAGVTGALAAGVLVALPFVLGGRTSALLAGLGDVAAFGNEYVSVVAKAQGGRSLAIAAGIPCWFEQIPTLLMLALLGASDLFRRSEERAPLAAAAWGFAAAALVGTSYTLRFFSHDNVQLWPALAALAVRPSGLIARGLDRFRWPAVAELAAPVALGWLAVWPGWRKLWDYVHFMGDRDDVVADICRALEPSLPANEPVLGWGWSAWSVYEHCGRRAPGRVFKVMASVTTVNTNTCNNGFGPMRLRSGAEPERFLAELERRPPSLFLWSNYFKEMGGDPLDEWPALTAFVRDRYTAVDRRGPFVAFLRRDLLPGKSAIGRQESREEPAGGSGLYGWPGWAGSVWTSTSRTPENSPFIASITQCVTR